MFINIAKIMNYFDVKLIYRNKFPKKISFDALFTLFNQNIGIIHLKNLPWRQVLNVSGKRTFIYIHT